MTATWTATAMFPSRGDWRAEVPMWAYPFLDCEDPQWRRFYQGLRALEPGVIEIRIAGGDVYVLRREVSR